MANIPSVSGVSAVSSEPCETKKSSRNIWKGGEEKEFLTLCKELKIAEELDMCLTSAGVRVDFCISFYTRTYFISCMHVRVVSEIKFVSPKEIDSSSIAHPAPTGFPPSFYLLR